MKVIHLKPWLERILVADILATGHIHDWRVLHALGRI
jgi:hypothetical protein